MHKVFREVSIELPLQLLKFSGQLEFQRKIKLNSKGLFTPVIARAITKQNRCWPTLPKLAHNWLEELDLIASQIGTTTVRQLRMHPNLINELYTSLNMKISLDYISRQLDFARQKYLEYSALRASVNKPPAKHRDIFRPFRLHQLSHSNFGRGNRI